MNLHKKQSLMAENLRAIISNVADVANTMTLDPAMHVLY